MRQFDQSEAGAPGSAVVYLDLDDRALLEQCECDTYRASGPGGQKRNKTDSAVRLRHRPTGIMAIAVESRSQHENRARALRRLRMTMALDLRNPVSPEDYRPSERMRRCLNGGGLIVPQRDPGRPQIVAEVLDLISGAQGQVSTAASRLGITTANLVKFLHEEPKLWAEVNRIRHKHDLGPLR